MNKKRLLVTCLTSNVASSVVFKVLKPHRCKGNDAVILLRQAFTSLANITALPIYKGKILYINIRGASFPSCFHEFKNYTPQLTDRYKNNKDIAFLYTRHNLNPELSERIPSETFALYRKLDSLIALH
jgi:hypothetical protein